jgi:hypothetical protein
MIMERIQEAKAGIRSLTGAIDTTTAPARMVMQKWSEHLLSLKERFSVSDKHITSRADIRKMDLVLVASEDGVRIINRTTGGRMYVMKTGKWYNWFEEPPIVTIENMHERYDYNQ